MKKMFNFIVAVVMLAVTFGATQTLFGNEALSMSVTGGLAVFSAVAQNFKFVGSLFNTITIPDFTAKSLQEVNDLTLEEQEAYMISKAKYESAVTQKSIQDAINEASKNNVSKEDVEKLEKSFNETRDAFENQILRIKNLAGKGQSKDEVVNLKTEVKANLTKISDIAKGNSSGEIELKAVTNRASVTNSTSSMTIDGVGQLGVKRRSLYNILTKRPVSDGDNQGKVRYTDWDEATTVRAAASVAEGVVFPESTAKFREYTTDLIKIGDTLPVTEEFFEDEVTLSNELEMFLDTNVNSVIDDQIINGGGAGDITGLLASTPAYVPVASGISDANIYDLVKKVSTDITFNRGSKYAPDMVVANANVLDKLWLHKDANDNYVFRDIQRIGSIELVEDNNMPDNQLVVGDKRYARLYEKPGVVITRGMVDKQFTEDMLTLKARKRLLFLIRVADRTGFRKVTDVDAALTVLETATGS